MPTMDLRQTMSALEKLGSAQTRKIWARHGATEPYFGVKIGDLKPLARKAKGRQDLALELYATGNLDAMYLAGLIADGARMTKRTLQSWAKAARSPAIAEYTVPWVASENPAAPELAKAWIDAKNELVAAAGWNTYAGVVSTRPDAQLDLNEVEGLLQRVVRTIGTAPNRVRYCMNNFVIAVGAAMKPLFAKAKAAAKAIGRVEVDMGATSCKVPDAQATLAKIQAMGRIGRKRATMKC
jgi:hypothetical protein